MLRSMIALTFIVTLSNLVLAEEPKAESRYVVPEGSSETLVKFIEGISQYEPENTADALLHRRQAPAAIRSAAEKIVAQEDDHKSEAYRLAKSIVLASGLRALKEKNEEQRIAYLADVEKYIGEGPVGKRQASLADEVASRLENLKDYPLAAKAFRSFSALLVENKNPGIGEMGKLFAGAAKRMESIGHSITITGKTIDGQDFDLASLKGKVVLVDFWATWCEPCLAELPNMRKLYTAYHERGFEIVGISGDEDRESLEEFLKVRKLPWIILHDEKDEGRHPATIEYGIIGIPNMILIDQQGKVVALNARGEELTKELARLIGPLDPSKASK